MMNVEYKIKNVLGKEMRFENIDGQEVAIYEHSHLEAVHKLMKTMDLREIEKHTIYITPSRFIWKR